MHVRAIGISGAVFVGISSVGALGWAGQPARFHLGLEASIVNSTSTDGTTPSSSSSTTSDSVKIVSNTTQFGLPGGAALSLGALVGRNFDIGTRFGYVSQTTKAGAESVAAEVETSAFTLTPYLAYVGGEPESHVRFTGGLAAGIGSGSTKTTTPGSSTGIGTTTSKSVEDSFSTVQFGLFAGLRGFASHNFSIDPMATVMKSSLTFKNAGGSDVDLSGLSFMLSVAFTLWSGGAGAAVATAAAPGATAPQSASGLAEAGTAADVQGNPSETPPEPVVKAPMDRITLPLGDERAVTLLVNLKSPAQTVKLVLRESTEQSNIATCQQIALHAPNHEDVSASASLGRATISTGVVPVLKAELPLESVRVLVDAPIGEASLSPNHWIDVCGRHWYLGERSRNQLKRFVDAVPAAVPSAAPSSAELPTPTAVEPAPSEAGSTAK